MAGLASAAPVAAVGAAVVPRSAPQALARSHFAPLQGDTFVFEKDALENVNARLVSIESLGSPGAAPDAEQCFRLLFEAPAQALPQRTFCVSHPHLGRFALFVSPNDAEGRIVEAVFNRL